jgi:hypothetical protein
MQGLIQEIQTKNTSVGTMYDFVIDGRTIGAGKFPPKGYEAGDYVNYDVIEKGKYLNLKPGSMSKTTRPAGVPAVAAPATTAPVVSGSAALANHDAREEAHSRGASLNSALAWFKILQDADALPINANIAKAKKADAMFAALKEFAGQFYKLSTGRNATFVDVDVEAVAGDLLGAEASDADWTE